MKRFYFQFFFSYALLSLSEMFSKRPGNAEIGAEFL